MSDLSITETLRSAAVKLIDHCLENTSYTSEDDLCSLLRLCLEDAERADWYTISTGYPDDPRMMWSFTQYEGSSVARVCATERVTAETRYVSSF